MTLYLDRWQIKQLIDKDLIVFMNEVDSTTNQSRPQSYFNDNKIELVHFDDSRKSKLNL